MRAQSVCGMLIVLFCFMFTRFSCRNEPNDIFATFGKGDSNQTPRQLPECYEATLTIFVAIIFKYNQFTSKEGREIGKINPMLLQIDLSFLFVPFILHIQIVTAICSGAKPCRWKRVVGAV
jgi:hypothetical protein